MVILQYYAGSHGGISVEKDKNPSPILLFVYNADGGILNAVKDAVKKTIAPLKYECRLCGLTYGAVSMKQEWRGFIRDLGIEVSFLHRDEFADRYGEHEYGLPAAFVVEDGKHPRVLISSEEMDATASLRDLMSLVKHSLSREGL